MNYAHAKVMMAAGAAATMLLQVLGPGGWTAAAAVETQTYTMDPGRIWSPAIWDGSHIYSFFGRSGSDASVTLDSIARVDPATRVVETMGAHLTPARWGAAAVWDGRDRPGDGCAGGCAYLFGGATPGATLADIVRYNPASDTVEVLPETLPATHVHAVAVWTGTQAFIFGGKSTCCGPILDSIVRYDPVTHVVITMTATMPAPNHFGAAVWDGQRAYVFGGGEASIFDTIVRYDPTTDTLDVLSTTLPEARGAATGVWSGSRAYIFGGWTPASSYAGTTTILEFNPTTGLVATLSDALPSARNGVGAAWIGGSAFLLGGAYRDGLWYVLDDVLRFTPTVPPGAPHGLTGAAGPGAGEIALTWNPPASDGGAAITNYRVYRGTASGSEAFLTELGNVTSYTDTGLGNGATRYYKVSAKNAAGEGALSNEASATTFSPPSAPRNLTADDGGPHNITLNWTAPSSDGGTPVTNYRIYRGNSSGSETFLTEVGNVLTYTDTGLPNGATRYYKVNAKNIAGEGARSNEAHTTTCNTTFQTLPSGVRIEVCIIL